MIGLKILFAILSMIIIRYKKRTTTMVWCTRIMEKRTDFTTGTL
jgi:hypothetical protein